VLYPTDDYGIIIIVNDTVDQHKVGEIENAIRHQFLMRNQ
jgi:hypothetical protein